MQNVMKDLETWGTRPGSALRSIGAVTFDVYGNGYTSEFYSNISEESCLEAGLVKDPDTVTWWLGQGDAAQKVLLKDQRPLREVGEAFNDWWSQNRGLWVWSQGSNFDVVLWEAAMRAVGLPVPWKFWDTRDTRTAYEMGKLNTRAIKRKGIHHFALDDAKHQAMCVQRAFARVRHV